MKYKKAFKKNYHGFAFDKKISKKHQQQLESRGFDDTELWNLDNTIAEFILPRLKAFRENPVGYPTNLTEKKWNKALDKIIFSLDLSLNDDKWLNLNIKERNILHKKYKKGFKLLGRYFGDLWQ